MHTTTIEHEYTFGDYVYIKTDPEQYERQIVEIVIHESGMIIYALQCGVDRSHHYEFELTQNKNYRK